MTWLGSACHCGLALYPQQHQPAGVGWGECVRNQDRLVGWVGWDRAGIVTDLVGWAGQQEQGRMGEMGQRNR